MKQFTLICQQRSLETTKYAELDLESGDYAGAFLRALAAIRLLGNALLISKGYYAPSARHVTKILHLHAIQDKYDNYVANPDEEAIGKQEAETTLTESKRLLAQAQNSWFSE